MHFRNYIHFILRVKLYELIDTLDQNKAQYVVNPLKDFKRKRKHVYEIDFDDAVPTLRTFLKHRDNKVDDLVRLLQRKRIPVRPDRNFERKVKGQTARIFIYKAA